MRRLFRSYWNLVYLLLMPMRVLIQNKMERQQKEEDLCEIWGKVLWVGEWKSHWIFGACLLDFNTQLQKYILSVQLDQLMRSAKNKTLLYLSKPRIRHRLDGPISDCKNVGVLPRAIAQNSHISSNQFHKIQNRRLAEGKFARGKGKNHQKMEIKYLQ